MSACESSHVALPSWIVPVMKITFLPNHILCMWLETGLICCMPKTEDRTPHRHLCGDKFQFRLVSSCLCFFIWVGVPFIKEANTQRKETTWPTLGWRESKHWHQWYWSCLLSRLGLKPGILVVTWLFKPIHYAAPITAYNTMEVDTHLFH